MSEVLEGDVLDAQETGQAPTRHEAPLAGPALFKTDDPLEVMQRTTEVANGLKDFVKAQGLTRRIGNSDHILVEGWQMLGMMLGITPVITKTSGDGGNWEAYCELRDRTGRVVGSGDAECLKSETTWGKRDDYARRSMAQTRAIGKAFRNTLGFIAKAAGFEATPIEEMPEPAASAPAPIPDFPYFLRDAIRALKPEAYEVEGEFRDLVESARREEGALKGVLKAMGDEYTRLGGDPAKVKEQWEARR